MWMRPSPWVWMPTRMLELSARVSNCGAGPSHWPHTFTSREACQWSPASPVAGLPARGAAEASSRRFITVTTRSTIPTRAPTVMPMFQPNQPPPRLGLRGAGAWGKGAGPGPERNDCGTSASVPLSQSQAPALRRRSAKPPPPRSPRLPGDLRRLRSAAEGVIGHREQRPHREERRRERERETGPPAPGLRREPVQGAVMLGDHAVRMLRGRRALHVGDARARLVADAPAPPAELPAEVDVLDVHEVPLVPSPHRRERGAPEPDGRTRDPVDVAPAARVGVELPVPAGEGVRGPHEAEQPVPDRVADPRHRTRRRIDGAVGVADHRADGPEV